MALKSFFNKSFVVLILLSALGLFIYFKTNLFRKQLNPTLIDRMPDADFLGRINVFDFMKESHDLMFYNRLPFRDLLSYEFILGQAKSIGLDLQKESYFFVNENQEAGILLSVKDSSKISNGILRAKIFVDIKKSIVRKYQVYHFQDQNIWMSYGNNWIFIYKGERLTRILDRISKAKNGQISKVWSRFRQQKTYVDKSLVIYSNYKPIQNLDIETAMFTHRLDSLNFSLYAYIERKKGLKVKLKPTGIALTQQPQSIKYLNLNLDLKELKLDPKDIFLDKFMELGKQVNFPMDLFFNAWEGGISFREGGLFKEYESVIEYKFDENFNPIETKTTIEKVVPGYAAIIEMNDQYKLLLNSLITKGIMTKEGTGFRFIGSPLLKLNYKKGHLYLYSGTMFPKTIVSKENNGLVRYKRTTFSFNIDSITQTKAYGRVSFPIKEIIKRKSIL